MNIEQLISPSVPTLMPADTGNHALELMDEHHFNELPIVDGEQYISLLQENDVLDWSSPDAALSGGSFINYKPAVLATAHPFEAMRIANQMNLSVIPVIDHEQKYVGAVTRDSLLKYITENSGIDSPGGIVVLEIAPRNYSLYEIARICENEDAIVLNSQVHTNEQGKLEVTLKLNRTVLEAVVASFERHEYIVREVYGDTSNNDDIEDKYNLLMNFINM